MRFGYRSRNQDPCALRSATVIDPVSLADSVAGPVVGSEAGRVWSEAGRDASARSRVLHS